MREQYAEPSEFQRFVRADSLENMLGLNTVVFPINYAKVVGKAPTRIAFKKSAVTANNIPFVMQASGKLQVSTRCESVDGERAMNIATHIVNGTDTEAVRSSLGGVTHLGVIHVKGDRCLARCEPSRIADVRRCVHSPNLMIKKKRCITEVPLHVSVLRISQALHAGLSWQHIPLGTGKKFHRRGVHEVIVGSEDPPPVDTIMLEGQVCLIKPHKQEPTPLEAQPRIVPVSAEPAASTGESAASAVSKKVQLALKMANVAMQGLAEQHVTASTLRRDSRLRCSVEWVMWKDGCIALNKPLLR